MGKWNNFFLQRMGTDKRGNEYPAFESIYKWGVWCKDIPFKIIDKVKAPAKRSWYDEHGDDEYISPDGLFLEAYTMKVEFGCKLLKAGHGYASAGMPVNDVRKSVGDFLKYLRESGMMKLYSTYTRIGRQNVRLESVSDNAKWKTDDGNEFLVFEVTFKVNDPLTDFKLNNSENSIIEDTNG